MTFYSKLKRPVIAITATVGLMFAASTPAFAAEATADSLELNTSYVELQAPLQRMATPDVVVETVLAETPLVEQLPPPPPPPPVVVAPVAAPAVEETGQQANMPSFVSDTGNAFVNAALAQLGHNQDCTALVENALRALGHNVGDLGPMQFGAYGSQVAQSDAQFGDIMMRGGHVAIYTGDGTNHSAIHGGWGGNQTVQSNIDADPYGYQTIIRLP